MFFRIFVVGWLLVLTAWIGTVTDTFPLGKHIKPRFPKPAASPAVAGATTTPENFPELKGLMSSDQNTRIAAARALVERVDVEKAQEMLKTSGLPFTGEGHLAVHQVGFYAYKKYGFDSILKCKDYFLYACYHGAIIEAASDKGVDQIAKMTDRCKENSARYFQCVHAAGHSILAMYEYNLPEALKTCDQLYEKEDKFPDALSSCHNGAFMENLFGVHDWGTNKTPKRDWLSDDPNYPCNAFEEKYQKGCWLNQAARMYQLYNGDLVKTTQACEAIGNQQYTEWCMDNVARQIHALTNGNVASVFSLCQYTGSKWMNNCIVVNAGSYYSVGDANAAINICKQISPAAKSSCYDSIIGQVVSDATAKDQKRSTCEQIEDPYKAGCLQRIAS